MDESAEDKLGASSISKARALEEIGEFWDEHDFTEFDTDAPDVDFDINPNLRIVKIERGEE